MNSIVAINLENKDTYYYNVLNINIHYHIKSNINIIINEIANVTNQPVNVINTYNDKQIYKEDILDYLKIYDIKINDLLFPDYKYLSSYISYLTKLSFTNKQYTKSIIIGGGNIDLSSIRRVICKSYKNQWDQNIYIYNILNFIFIKDLTNIIMLYYSNYILTPTIYDIDSIINILNT